MQLGKVGAKWGCVIQYHMGDVVLIGV